MPITDLTGYTWVGNSTITWNSMMSSYYSISFTSNNENFTHLSYWESPDEVFLEYDTPPYTTIDAYDFNTNQWSNDAYKTITITGGTDATNSTLIAWLEANGTLTAPQPQQTDKIFIGTSALSKSFLGNIEVSSMWLGSVKIYDSVRTLLAPTISITDDELEIVNNDVNSEAFDLYIDGVKETTIYKVETNITNGSFTGDNSISYGGTSTITLSAAAGYVLPSSITVTGASYTYNSSTGEVNLSNPTGKVNLEIICEIPAINYTVDITGGYTGGHSTYYVYDGQDTTAQQVGTFLDGNTTSVTCTSGYLYISGGGAPGAYSSPGTVSGGVSIVSNNIPNGVLYSVVADGTITGIGWGCFVEGTQITLADYTTKNIEDITYDDELLVWDFYEGKLASAKPTWIMREGIATEYKKITLSDGTIMKLVGTGDNCHRLFNISKQEMIYANECVGDEVYKQDGTIVTVLSCEKVQEEVKYYNLTTEKYLDCFAEGVLTGSRLNNMYHISNMKYDSQEKLLSDNEITERWKIREQLRK